MLADYHLLKMQIVQCLSRIHSLTRLVQRLPVLVHERQQIVFAVLVQQRCNNIAALPRRDDSTVGEAGGSIGRWVWVVLSGQVAVLAVSAVALVWPEAVDSPGALGEDGAVSLETGELQSVLCHRETSADDRKVTVATRGGDQHTVSQNCVAST